MRRIVLVALLAGFLLLIPESASAACHWTTTTELLDGHVQVHTVWVCDDQEQTGGTEDAADHPFHDSALDPMCVRTALGLGQDPYEFCAIPGDEDEPVEITPGMVAAAFQLIPLPASQLQVQPANGRTLVNFETNFFTESAPFDRTVVLLGQQVQLHIVPSSFGWRFGDGAVLSGADAGARYPDLRITHEYQRKGSVQPAVDTTYTATYRVNGGASAAVPGSVTIAGVPVGLEVLTATPTLVGS